MRRRLKVSTASVIAILLMVALGTPPANAWTSLGCKWATTNIRVRIPAPLLSAPDWEAAVNRWPSSLDARHLANPTGTTFHVHAANENRGNTVAWAGIFRKRFTVQTVPDCVGGRWVTGDTEVVLNWTIVNQYTQTKRRGIAAHELGHSFGLGHVSSNNAVMYTHIASSGSIFFPTTDDRNGVNALY